MDMDKINKNMEKSFSDKMPSTTLSFAEFLIQGNIEIY